MPLENLHKQLLGINPLITPSKYHLTERQKELYRAFDEGTLGIYLPSDVASRENAEDFLALFIMALHKTHTPSPGQVSIAVAKPVESWAMQQIEGIVRRIFACRKKSSKKDIEAVKRAINLLDFGTSVLKIDQPPSRWVAYGFLENDILPLWMKEHLK